MKRRFAIPEQAAGLFGGMTDPHAAEAAIEWPRASGPGLMEALGRAVRRLSKSKRPVVALSGGLDSSLILAMLARSGMAPVPVILDDGACNPVESENAWDLCGMLSIEPVIARADPAGLPARFAEAARACGGLIVNARAVSKFLLFEEAAKIGGAVFSGAGADEVLFGDPEDALLPPRWFRSWRSRLDFARGLLFPEYRPALPELPEADPLLAGLRLFRLCTETARLILPVERGMPLSLGLDPALPFLEPEVVSAALALGPVELVRPGGQGKTALREIAGKWLPDRFCSVAKKPVVMPAPGRDDIGRDNWAGLFKDLLDRAFFERMPCFDREKSLALIDDYTRAVEPVLSHIEFALMSLCSVSALAAV